MARHSNDFNGNKVKGYMAIECSTPLTVGELKRRLEEYPDDANIYIEASNSNIRNDTSWAQRALDTYPCKGMSDKKALMIVGSMR